MEVSENHRKRRNSLSTPVDKRIRLTKDEKANF